MKLRVVAGSLKGRILAIPSRDQGFRPSRERVREAVAAILAPRIYGARVADICAGSGIFGFEMISRGARGAVFVENDRFRGAVIGKHAQRFGVADSCRIVVRDAVAFVDKCSDPFDIVYYDPPYDDVRMAKAVPLLLRLLAEGGVLAYERRSVKKRQRPESLFGMPQPFDCRVYGETEIYMFTNSPGKVREPPLR